MNFESPSRGDYHRTRKESETLNWEGQIFTLRVSTAEFQRSNASLPQIWLVPRDSISEHCLHSFGGATCTDDCYHESAVLNLQFLLLISYITNLPCAAQVWSNNL